MRWYYLLGRVSSPVQLTFFYLFNRIFHVPRSRVLVWNERGELLLVRNWGGKRQWALPGGGVERNEEPIAAAKRELHEELGIDLPLADFSYVETVHYQYEAIIFRVQIRAAMLPNTPYNPWEITDMQWFSLKNLPADLSPVVSLALKNYQNQADIAIM